LPVGGAWLLLGRAGLDPLGVGSLLVLLTAVHFHYAAFAGLALVAQSARALELAQGAEPRYGGLLRLLRIIVVGIVVGIFLVAAGISGVPALGMVGAACLTACLFGHAWLTLLYVMKTLRGWLAKLCLGISSLSLLLSMPLAMAWAWGQLFEPLLDLTLMLRIHGMANAHGFALAGLLGWGLHQRPTASD
jgi:hypothetical protein